MVYCNLYSSMHLNILLTINNMGLKKIFLKRHYSIHNTICGIY